MEFYDDVTKTKEEEWCCFILSEIDETSLYVMRRHYDLKEIYGEDVVIKKFEKSKGWLAKRLSSENYIDSLSNVIEEKSIWQRYGF